MKIRQQFAIILSAKDTCLPVKIVENTEIILIYNKFTDNLLYERHEDHYHSCRNEYLDKISKEYQEKQLLCIEKATLLL